MRQVLGLVANLHQLPGPAIFIRMDLGILDHLLDLRLRQAAGGLDHDGLLLAGGFVLRRHIQDAIGVYVKSHLDLRRAPGRRRDVRQVKPAQGLVAIHHLALALQHMDCHRGLVVRRRGEHLLGLGGDGGVLLYELGHHPPQSLYPQGERGHIQQQHILDIAAQHAGLYGGAHGDGLVRVDILARLLAEELLRLLLHLGHAGLPAHQNDIGDLGRGDPGILQGHPARLHGAVHQVFHQGLQLGAAQLEVQVLGAAGVRRDVGQVDVGLLAGGQLYLGLLRRLLQPLQGQGIVVQVYALGALELVAEKVDDPQVKILPAQESVPVGGQHLKLAFAIHLGDLDDGHIEGAAAQVINGDAGVPLLLVHAIRQRRRRRLVDDALHLQPGDLAGVLGGLTLGIVEIGRHGDDRRGHRLPQVVLRRLLHLHQHPRGDLRRGHFLALDLHPGVGVVRLDDLVRHHVYVFLHHAIVVAPPDQPLDGEQGVSRIGDGLALGGLAHQHLIVIGKRDDGRGGAAPFAVFYDPALAAFQHRHAGIRRAKIYADYLAH